MAKRTKNDDEQQQQPDEQPTVAAPAPVRGFYKHDTTGEIVAIEWLDTRRAGAAAARACSRPEEQSRGALPVLILDDGDMLAWVEEHRAHLKPWDPPLLRDEALAAILQAGAEAAVAKSAWKEAAEEASDRKKRYDRLVEKVEGLIAAAQAGVGQDTLPFDGRPSPEASEL